MSKSFSKPGGFALMRRAMEATERLEGLAEKLGSRREIWLAQSDLTGALGELETAVEYAESLASRIENDERERARDELTAAQDKAVVSPQERKEKGR